ncbi:MAG: hypothetical protein KIT72_05095 [Polyangiaceae bacterium]|nr:hypothetical protein [Polyangiaceae bacterium]MCW5789780.1 hypothetical protein [Polyangiaceae bacterium]
MSSLDTLLSGYEAELALLPGATTNRSVGNNVGWFRAFKPVHSRAMAVDGATVYHPQPYALEEVRYRGARAYCSMRQAARQQDISDKRSFGSHPGTGIAFWDLGRSESKISIGQVHKDTSSPITNAFVIPIGLNSNLAPLHGLGIPTLGEMSHPIAWVTGDSILVSQEAGSEVWVNSQHADAFFGNKVEGTVTASLPLAKWGFVALDASMGLDAKYGVLLPVNGQASPFSTELSGGSVWYAPSLRTYKMDKKVGANYRPWSVASDSPMRDDLEFNIPQNDNYFQFRYHGSGFPSWGMGTSLRVYTQDDRSLTIGDRVSQSLALTASGIGGADIGLVKLAIEVKGTSSLAVETQRLTTIREQVSAVHGDKLEPPAAGWTHPSGPWQPYVNQANFVAIPEHRTDINWDPLTISLDVTLTLRFLFKTKTYSKTWPFYKAPTVTVPVSSGVGPESSRLRVGSFTDFGVEYFGPGVDVRSTYSHLPYPEISNEGSVPSFASYPQDELYSVGACLADTGPVPGSIPPPAPGLPAMSDELDLCIYGPACVMTSPQVCVPWGIPANVCSPGWIDANVMNACHASVFKFLCNEAGDGTHRVQHRAGYGNVIARWGSEHDVVSQMDACVATANPQNDAEADLYAEVLQSMFRFGLCDQDLWIQGE